MTVSNDNMNVPEIIDFYRVHGLYKSRQDYSDKFKHLEFFNSYTNITIEVINKYCSMRSATGVRNSTINREISIMRAAFTFYLKHKPVNFKNVFVGFKLFEDDFIPRYLDETDCKRLLYFTKRYENPMLHDFVLLLMNTGCRSSELLKLTWDNVFLDQNYFVVRNSLSKNSKTVHKPINADSYLAFRRLRQMHPNAKYVFYNPETCTHYRSFRKGFKLAVERSRIGDLRIHDLRHTFASILVQRGVPIYEVSTLLGHSDTRITQRYAHFSPKHLHDAVRVLPSFLG